MARRIMQCGRFSTHTYDCHSISLSCDELLWQTWTKSMDTTELSSLRTHQLWDVATKKTHGWWEFPDSWTSTLLTKGPLSLSLQLLMFLALFYFSLPPSKEGIYWGDYGCRAQPVSICASLDSICAIERVRPAVFSYHPECHHSLNPP